MTTKPAKPSKRWTVSTFRVVTCASTKPKNVAHLVAAAVVVVVADIAAAAAEIVVAVAAEIVVAVAVAVVVTTAVVVAVIVAPITEVGKLNAPATFIQKTRRKRRAFFCAPVRGVGSMATGTSAELTLWNQDRIDLARVFHAYSRTR
jgi:hypothetical protein